MRRTRPAMPDVVNAMIGGAFIAIFGAGRSGVDTVAVIYLRTSYLRKKFNEIPVMIVTSAIRKIASGDPSPWSGEKPKYFSIKSIQHSPPWKKG
jgi:hypothetical protein